MSEDHAHAHAPDFEPEGNFEFTNGKMAMWLFLVSDAMAFIGFLGAYMVLRISAGPEGWNPPWGPALDKILTGLNTFVLICSSVTMVKAFSNLVDGNIKKCRMYLLGTVLGGAFFVGFQCYEWTHFMMSPNDPDHRGLGITMSGLIVPDLETAMERADERGLKVERLGMAERLFGKRKLPDDFDAEGFTEKEFLELPLVTMDQGYWDNRPVSPGVIHSSRYGLGQKASGKGEEKEILRPREDRDTLASVPLPEQREKDARYSTNFASSFFVLTGFHGLHVFLGVIYMLVVWFKVGRGDYNQKNHSPVEVAGLYWHFVDLVWVLLFMLIYLI